MEHMLNIESKFNDKQCQSVDFFISRINMPNGETQKINVWITSGEIKNIAMIRAFLIQRNIYIIAFSLNSEVSLDHAINTWFDQCVKNAGTNQTFYYFLGTMSDKQRVCGTYQEIIDQILLKTKSDTFPQQKLSKIDQRESICMDDMTSYCVRTLPSNISYSETSAISNNGMHKSIKILTSLIEQCMKPKPIIKAEPITPLTTPTYKRDTIEITASTPKLEEKQEKTEKFCCYIF